MATDNGKITSLVSISLATGGVSDFLLDCEAVLHALISLGQIAVALFTVIYIVKKTRAIQNGTARTDAERTNYDQNP